MNSIAYMHAAYAVVWSVLGGYALYLASRFFTLRKEYEELRK